jgi:hypothetical protein
MVLPIEVQAPMPPPCPGRTIFDALADSWPDQVLMRAHTEALHQLDLARAAQPPVLNVTVVSDTGPLNYQVDPGHRTVSVGVTGPPEAGCEGAS